MTSNADDIEVPLLGGDVTEGVVRVGDTVRRPVSGASDAVRRVLGHLESVGFAGAPRFHGVDAKGRDILDFVDGEVAGRPWPEWVADPERIAGVAMLVRAYDDAVESLGVPDWATELRHPDPPGIPASIAPRPTLVGHLDVTPENVVFREGRAAALIDFDLIRPATRAEEVTNVLLWWGGWMPVDDRERATRDVDPVATGTLIVDAYGLDDAARAVLVELAINQADRSWFLMKSRAETLGGGWQRMWDDGIGDRIRRRAQWLRDNAERLERAVRG
ncbi:phosphotransferase [Microbacterium sp. ASV49]|uniref:Phosphotransferase n=1 Tax=Microbacterium candidum TaxID=3041922 RepID=A0ABT7N2P8_9MICO|nr:phosphotransferase [Microbacterium sp. ASV49]MDL9980980.1 phosphotransferase [Microbacterium sp. ASV49]